LLSGLSFGKQRHDFLCALGGLSAAPPSGTSGRQEENEPRRREGREGFFAFLIRTDDQEKANAWTAIAPDCSPFV